ncbi:MAG TPA: hypothetical protein PKJ99_09125 [Thermoanaerobaculales bacterium]|nr:hypothetical protein [Thermoanaerobaculales bacterium]HQL30064.1 hypothetical protein [Thermoanaerobaculales bacterium]HQN96864.1 hypothetical protein [Thermoanaerobaculales bacterium]
MKSSMRVVIVAMMLTAGAAALVQADDTVAGTYRGLQPVVRFDVSPPLRDIPPVPVPEDAGGLMVDPDAPAGELGPQDVDPVVQGWAGGPEMIPAPLVSFPGQTNLSGVAPPDPVGDVGPNHYVAMSNLHFAVFDKAGALLYGPAASNTLWSGFGGDCQTDNDGDPVVLYDQLADRWVLTQFTASGPTYFNCIAVSTSGNPLGSWYRYAVSTGSNFPDYPKYGVWPDAYYISTREFAGGSSYTGVGAYAINRAQVIAGNPTPTIISFFIPRSPQYIVGDGLLPADLDGTTLPPAGSPQYFVGSMDNGASYGAPQDALTLWKFDADFTTPANSSFTLTHTLPIAAYDTIFPCTPTSRNCIPQPDTSNKVDILSYRQRPLHRLAYRNFGDYEAMVTNQSVEASTSMAGIRWWELRDPAGTPVIYQEGTYAPGVSDGVHRWMGSIAQDSAGNMALGFSASSSTVYPSSWYTGRLAGDPLGTMPQGEGSFIDGTGSQTGGSGRWGDYTSMNVDPIDDCTFWYVNQYLPATSSSGWRLQIGAFRFDQCGTPDFYLGATPGTAQICAGADAQYTINVGAVGGFGSAVTLAAAGGPPGSTADFSINPVAPPSASVLTVGNTAGSDGGSFIVTVSGAADGSMGHSIEVVLDVIAGPAAPPALTAPPDGATGQPVQPDFQWAAAAGADSYRLEVDDDPAFASPEISVGGIIGTSYSAPAALAEGTTFHWRVSSENLCGAGAASTAFSFTTLSSLPFADGFESGDTSVWSATVP